MNFKLVAASSVAALSFTSASFAADAIVAAEPEPMEYVRVCDAFGAGFFYIPGSETCLKIGGYVRFQVNFGRDASNGGVASRASTSDWDVFTRGQLDIDARSDSELGTLRGFIGLQGNADNNGSRGVNIDQAFIEVGGLKVGYFFNWWDDKLSGENDMVANGQTTFNAIRYTYTAGDFYAGVAVDELEGAAYTNGNVVKSLNNVGIEAIVGAAFGPVKINLLGGYDTDQENGAVRGIAMAELGPGTLGLAAIYASGQNAYYDASEWTVAAEYALKVTDKFTVTPGFQYFWTIDQNGRGDFAGSRDAWGAGVTLDYQLATNLSTKIFVQYRDEDQRNESWNGFLRLQRAF
ncbi:porin [Rhizobium helianthi]|uniref:Porin n=1 Tax=Rhizobium helianthi TaxID=1132695 RepID=A0ABW4M2N8_9HYPH